MNPRDDFDAAAELLVEADALLLTAGAGMGVDSGLPDFRGDQGFWKAYPAFAKLGLRFVDLANPYWFDEDPQLAWGFYGHRHHLYRATIPHRGFQTLLRWAEAMPAGHFVYTSNVDGHFVKGGFSPNRVVECHGSIQHLQCSRPCLRSPFPQSIWEADGQVPAVDAETCRAVGELPRCPRCGALARPNILMFGDGGWVSDRTESQMDEFVSWIDQLSGKRLVVLEFGAGTAVPTIRHLGETLVRSRELKWARLIRVNVREPEVPSGEIGLPCTALEAIDALELRLADGRMGRTGR